MATTAPVALQTSAVQLRTVALSAIIALDGWNPACPSTTPSCRPCRPAWSTAACLAPVILEAAGNGDYRLVDGEKR